ncbi:MAG: ABC transporter permease [Firmicutes bacterium]|nr:ABC transporter permease [Bacillota bacterium]
MSSVVFSPHRRVLWRRFLEYGLTLFVVISFNFLLPRLLPGSPFSYLSGEAQADLPLPGDAAYRAYLEDYYGLNRPLLQQYALYWLNLARGDLGLSYYYQVPVLALLARRIPWTLALAVASLFTALLLAMYFGVQAAWQQGHNLDRRLLTVFISLRTIPSFFLGVILLLLFGYHLNLFPLSGALSPGQIYRHPWELALDYLEHFFLPYLTLTLFLTPGLFLTVRSSVLGVLGEDFLQVARLRGLPEGVLKFRYALRNALLPVLTQAAMRLGHSLGGAILVENVFSYPGMGKLLQEALAMRDYPVLQGIFLLVTVGILLANLVMDLLYPRLDPRLAAQ